MVRIGTVVMISLKVCLVSLLEMSPCIVFSGHGLMDLIVSQYLFYVSTINIVSDRVDFILLLE